MSHWLHNKTNCTFCSLFVWRQFTAQFINTSISRLIFYKVLTATCYFTPMNQQKATVLTANNTSMRTPCCQHSRIFHEWRITSVAVNKPRCVQFYTCSSQHGIIFLGITDGILPFDIHAFFWYHVKKSDWSVHLNMDQNRQSDFNLQVNHSNKIIMYSDRQVRLGNRQTTTMRQRKKNKNTQTLLDDVVQAVIYLTSKYRQQFQSC